MYEHELNIAKEAVRETGDILLKYLGKKIEINRKRSSPEIFDLVTDADIKSEKAIIKKLKKNFPNYGILAEESGTQGNQEIKWIIDPLDGTHNFSRGNKIFGISIALEVKGTVVLGVVEFPALKETYYSIKGSGAFFNGKKIKTSTRLGKDCEIIFDGTETFSKIRKIVEKIEKEFNPLGIRIYRCTIYSSMAIASGKHEGLFTLRIKPWDIAAGALIVEESGGKVTNLKGEKWNPYQSEYILSNNVIHRKLLKFY